MPHVVIMFIMSSISESVYHFTSDPVDLTGKDQCIPRLHMSCYQKMNICKFCTIYTKKIEFMFPDDIAERDKRAFYSQLDLYSSYDPHPNILTLFGVCFKEGMDVLLCTMHSQCN